MIGAIALVALILLFAVVIPAIQLALSAGNQDAGADAVQQETRVTFVAVGDNLPDEYIGQYADKRSGAEGDETYDYYPMFEPIVPYVQAADLSYINQETHVGGQEFGPQGYPAFNTTDEMADAVVKAGFDLVASATNHSYDWGYYGALEHSLSVWEKQPVAFTGTAVTQEQYERIPKVERNGLTFALINYTYGVNGYTQAELPQYAVNFIDEDRICQDVARARQEGADVIIAAMHWGTENLTEADDQQKAWAQLLANLNVDIVVGSHPHVIGPMEWVANSDGSGHKTLVAYSLGNFLADHESPNAINVVEGMLSCDFVRDEATGGEGQEGGENGGQGSSSQQSGNAENQEGSQGDSQASGQNADQGSGQDAGQGDDQAASQYATDTTYDEEAPADGSGDTTTVVDGQVTTADGSHVINVTPAVSVPAGNVRIENVKWTPLVCHSNANRDEFGVYAIDDYTDELAKKNRVFTETDDPIGWVWQQTKSIVGEQWFSQQG